MLPRQLKCLSLKSFCVENFNELEMTMQRSPTEISKTWKLVFHAGFNIFEYAAHPLPVCRSHSLCLIAEAKRLTKIGIK